jgi:phage terminase large subunit-like protein
MRRRRADGTTPPEPPRSKRRRGRKPGGGDSINDSATRYARAVVAGEIVAGRLVRLACERHLRDLETGHQRGLLWDSLAAERAIQFFTFLTLAEGEHAGKPFVLRSFQCFIVGSLFGWKGTDGYRRFRTAYNEIAKGNGKSPKAAGVGILGLVADGEKGAEIYAAAVGREQAKIVWRDADAMVEASATLAQRVTRRVNNLSVLRTRSFFRPVSSEHRGLDGKRVHMAIIDELHEHPTSIVVDKMSAGTKGRRQPLIFEITNSGYDRTSVCWAHHEYSVRVLEGSIADDSWFAFICGLDACDACRARGKTQPTDGCKDCDDWRDESVWIKANPNLGVSITAKYLRQQVAEAVGMPSKQNIVKRLNFCIWTEQADRWLDVDLWNACSAGAIDESALEGRDAYLSIDLSSTSDIAAACLAFPSTPAERAAGAKRFRAIWRFWIPEATLRLRTEREREMLQAWIDAGYITATKGNVIDYDVIRDDLNALGDRFAIKECAYDPWNATQLATQLQGDGFLMIAFRQGFKSLNEPTKEVEKLVTSQELDHGGNPVAAWMASNVSVAQDAAGNKKPDKSRSVDRIDGITTLVMSIGRATVQPEQQGSVYDTRGIITL